MFKSRLFLILCMLFISRFSYAGINDAVKWLDDNQNADYSWGNIETTGFRDTCVVTETLLDLERNKTNLLRAVEYIETTELDVCDYLARKIKVLSLAGIDVGSITNILASYKIDWVSNNYYYASFGYQKDDLGTPLDTSLVLSTLLSANYRGTQTYTGILNYLLSSQYSFYYYGYWYGYWQFNSLDTVGSIYCTSQVLLSLVQLLDERIFTSPTSISTIKNAINKGINWLKAQQNQDGSFGSTLYETSVVALAFLAQPELRTSQNLKDALKYIRDNQNPNGSWNGRAYDTGIALKSLTRQKIIVSPNSGTAGIIVKLTGAGFGQTETIRIDFGQSPTIAAVMTNAKGSFTTNFTIDRQPAGMITITATGLNSGLSGTTYFNIIFKPSASITISPTSGYVGSIVTVTGEGFEQTETIVIDFGITRTISTAMTNGNGRFATTFTVNVQAGCGTLTVSAYGLASNLFARTQFLMQARITLVTPTFGSVGSKVTVAGDGFHTSEEIVINFGINSTITMSISDSLGQFSTVFTVDTQAGGGTITVSAKGLISGGEAYSKFVIAGNIILVSPSSGTVGASVTIAGNGFGAIEQIQIDFGTTLTICLSTTDAKGSFTATFKVNSQPYGLKTIIALGLLSNAKAYAIFNINPDFVIIRGKVVDSMSNKPIRKAVIKIIQNNQVKSTATTDNKGNYRIENIPAGIYQIRAKKEIVHRWRQITWRRLVYIPHTKYQVEVNRVDNEVNFYLSRAHWVEWAHIEEGNKININEKKNMDVRIKVNYDPKYWFYLYPKDATSYEIKDFSRQSIGLNGCWSRKRKWYNIDWDNGTYIDKANNRLHIKVWISGYWWRRAYFNYRYTIDCQLKEFSNKDKNRPIVAFESEKNKTPKIGMVKLAINRIKLEQQGANPLQEEKNVLSVMVKDVEDTLTTAKINLKFNPDKVKIEDIKSPVLPDAGLKVFVEGKIDKDKGSVQVEALVVDEDLLIGTYTDVVDKTTLPTTQQVFTNRDTSDIQEENIAPIAHIIIEPKEIKRAKGLNLDDMLSYVEIEGIELRNAQGEEIQINVEDIFIKPTYTSDLTSAYCYPNPTNKGWITFAKLTERVKVRIFNIAGELIYEEEPRVEPEGKWQWKCVNNAGEKVASGIYIYILKDPVSGSMKRGKLGVIR